MSMAPFLCINPTRMAKQLRSTISPMNSWQWLLITHSMLNWVLLTSVNVLEEIAKTYGVNKICRLSTTTDETLHCLTSLFYEYSIPALRNCLVDSGLLPEAPKASYLADGLYHVLSRIARLQIRSDIDGLPVSISTLLCQACLILPSCSSTLTFSHGDLVLTLDMNFCETRPEPFVASFKLTPCSAVFNTLPPATADLKVYSFGKALRKLFSSEQLQLAALPHVKKMTGGDLRTVTKPISHYYTTISPSTVRVSTTDITCLWGLLSHWHVYPWLFLNSFSASVLRSSGVSGKVSSNIHNSSPAARTAASYTLFLSWTTIITT